MPAIERDQLYTPAEVAAFLRCGKSNVYDLVSDKELACIRVGAGRGSIRIMGSDLLVFLESRREGGPEPKGRFKHLRAYLD